MILCPGSYLFSFIEKNDEINSMYYVSWISDILLAILMTSFIVLIPQHNILQEPEYWYEFFILGSLNFTFICTAVITCGCAPLRSNIHYAKNLESFTFIFGLASLCYALANLLYYYIWVHIFGKFSPMPFNLYVSCTIGFLPATWFCLFAR